jgi:hypothetical protein
MNKHDRENLKWAEECEYLARLLETGGDDNVPKGALRFYFQVQKVGAHRERFYCLAATLAEIADRTTDDASAIVSLRAHAAALRPVTD